MVEFNAEVEARRVREILHTRSEDRSVEDVNFIYEWVMQNDSMQRIFTGVQEIICKTICREMTLEKIPANRIVCQQGDYGDTFYIIVHGVVSLIVLTDPEAIDANNKAAALRSGNHTDENEYSPGSDRECFGKFIKTLETGATFGELAVMDPSSKRSCSILTDVDTFFIVLKRAAYQRLTRSNTRSLSGSIIQFLQSIFIFKSWPRANVVRLSNHMKKIDLPAGSFLTKHGGEALGLYIVLSGTLTECMPMMTFTNSSGSDARHFPLDDILSKEKYGNTYQLLSKTHLRRYTSLELMTLTTRDICGEHPIIFGRQSHATSIVATTDVEVLFLDRNSWIELFLYDQQSLNTESLLLIKSVAHARDGWRKTRVRLAVDNPGNILTVSTYEMMEKLTKLLCGFCGQTSHLTGSSKCPSVLKEKQITLKAQEEANARALKRENEKAVQEYERLKVMRETDPELQLAWKRRNGRLMDKVRMIARLGCRKESLSTSKELVQKGVELTSVKRKMSARRGSIVERRSSTAGPNLLNGIDLAKLKLSVNNASTSNSGSSSSNTRSNSICSTIESESAFSSKSSTSRPPTNAVVITEYRREMLQQVKKMKNMSRYCDIKKKTVESLSSVDASKASNQKEVLKPRVPKTSKRRHANRTTARNARYNKRLDRKLLRLNAEFKPAKIEESLK